MTEDLVKRKTGEFTDELEEHTKKILRLITDEDRILEVSEDPSSPDIKAHKGRKLKSSALSRTMVTEELPFSS